LETNSLRCFFVRSAGTTGSGRQRPAGTKRSGSGTMRSGLVEVKHDDWHGDYLLAPMGRSRGRRTKTIRMLFETRTNAPATPTPTHHNACADGHQSFRPDQLDSATNRGTGQRFLIMNSFVFRQTLPSGRVIGSRCGPRTSGPLSSASAVHPGRCHDLVPVRLCGN